MVLGKTIPEVDSVTVMWNSEDFEERDDKVYSVWFPIQTAG